MAEYPDVTASPESSETEFEKLRAQNAELLVLVAQLRQRVAALEARLNKDSHNSSKPPSSDSKLKKPPPRSQRKATGRKSGGQPGHPGATLDLVDAPEERVVVPLSGSCACGRCRGEIAVDILPERRQVVELEIRRKVTEYRTVAGTCTCGRAHRSDFPEGVAAPVQYGPSVSALAVYLTQYQLLPYLDQHCWSAIRISGGMLNKIKFIAGYQTAPISAITHYAPVDRIEPYGDAGKYNLVFSEPAKPLGPIPLGDSPPGTMQGPRYTTFSKLKAAKTVAELLVKK
jgi:transposase